MIRGGDENPKGPRVAVPASLSMAVLMTSAVSLLKTCPGCRGSRLTRENSPFLCASCKWKGYSGADGYWGGP